MLPWPNEPYEMHTDASDFAGIRLHQNDVTHGDLRPIAYESHKLSEGQRRHAMHERELLAVVHALQVWRMYLVGSAVTVRTDHMPPWSGPTRSQSSPSAEHIGRSRCRSSR